MVGCEIKASVLYNMQKLREHVYPLSFIVLTLKLSAGLPHIVAGDH